MNAFFLVLRGFFLYFGVGGIESLFGGLFQVVLEEFRGHGGGEIKVYSGVFSIPMLI